jgi:hypothetical protein
MVFNVSFHGRYAFLEGGELMDASSPKRGWGDLIFLSLNRKVIFKNLFFNLKKLSKQPKFNVLNCIVKE